MPLDLPHGVKCFVDANILYYHFVDTLDLSAPCSSFLERVADGDILGFTSTHMLSEAVHKVMLSEAASVFGLNRAGLVNWLQRHRDRITELSAFRQAAHEMTQFGLKVLPVDSTDIADAASISKESSLLTNDALIVLLIRRHGLENLATIDDDFDALPGLTIWKPR